MCVANIELFFNKIQTASYLLFLIDTASKTPRTIPSSAAKSTRCSEGKRKVMVCAGYQKKGIVFLKTKPHCACQLISEKRLAMGIGVMRDFSEPP